MTGRTGRVCDFFLQGRCRFGESCKNEHPREPNRFAPLSNQGSNPGGRTRSGGFGGGDRYRPGQDQKLPYSLNRDTIKADLTRGGPDGEKPDWPLSSYGPGRDAPRQLLEGLLEQSFEETRVLCYAALTKNLLQDYLQNEADAKTQANLRAQNILDDLDNAIQYVVDGEKQHPNRLDQIIKNTEGLRASGGGFGQPPPQPSNGSAFGQPSAGAASSGGFGQPPPQQSHGTAFGQPSTSSAIGQPSRPGGASAFGQPSQPGSGGSAFGQPSQPGGGTGFGQPSKLGAGSAFGQPSSLGAKPSFGQPSQPAIGSAFGQPSQPGSGGSAFGQPSQPGGSGFGQASKLGAGSAFGQPSSLGAKPSSGQPSQPAIGSAFGQPSAPGGGGSSGLGQLSQPAIGSAFGQPSAPGGGGSSGFGQPSQPTSGSAFGQPSAPGGGGSSGFGQPSAMGGGQQQQQQPRSPFGQASGAGASNPFTTSSIQTGANPFAAPKPANTPTPSSAPAAKTAQPNGTHATGIAATADYTSRTGNGTLQGWKGQQVLYDEKHNPTYLNPQTGKAERIWHPNGPPEVPNSYAEAPQELYAGDLGAVLKEAYDYVRENEEFKDGVMPELPPKKEWVRWDL